MAALILAPIFFITSVLLALKGPVFIPKMSRAVGLVKDPTPSKLIADLSLLVWPVTIPVEDWVSTVRG